jgi:anaerobic ribonucleoside-triphosphate reductase
MLEELRTIVKYGVKTRYYQNSYVSSKQRTASTAAQQAVSEVIASATEDVEFIGTVGEEVERGCAGGACTI